MKKRSKKRGPVRAKKVRQDGINFASGLLKNVVLLELKKLDRTVLTLLQGWNDICIWP
jgi:hypothetical protein